MLAFAIGRLRCPGREHDDGDEGSEFHEAEEHWVHEIIRDRERFNALIRAGHLRLDAEQAAVLHEIENFLNHFHRWFLRQQEEPKFPMQVDQFSSCVVKHGIL